MLLVKLISGEDGADLHVEQPYDGFHRITNDTNLLVVTDPYRTHGAFQTAQIITPTTTTVVAPEGDGSLVITDIVVSAKKVNNTSLTLQFSDGVNTAVILAPDTINEPVSFSWAPQGRIQGWRNAAIQVITGLAGTPAVTVTVGYMRAPTGLLFAEWDAHR